MCAFDYQCESCGCVEEYNTSPSLPKEMQVPDACVKCGGKLKRLFSSSKRIAVDVPGGYDYEYGTRAWRKNLSTVEQAQVLMGDKNPY